MGHSFCADFRGWRAFPLGKVEGGRQFLRLSLALGHYHSYQGSEEGQQLESSGHCSNSKTTDQLEELVLLITSSTHAQGLDFSSISNDFFNAGGMFFPTIQQSFMLLKGF